LSSTIYNGLLKDHYDLAINNHREAVFMRWEAIGNEFRSEVMQTMLRLSDEIVEACSKLLLKHFSVNPQISYLNELVEWEIPEDYRKLYLTDIVDKLPLEDCVDWVTETAVLMNREGFNKWRGFSIQYAAEVGKIQYNSLKAALETALDLGQERARLALTVLSKVNLSKSDLKYFREKIIRYYNEFPELVNHFGYRFKL